MVMINHPEECRDLLNCTDLTKLDFLYEDEVVECISTRYRRGILYTWAGSSLLAINPQRLREDLYDSHQIEKLHDEVKNGRCSETPHIFGVAALAYHHLRAELGLVNQAVVVSGESGAGKTESTRYMLNYLTHVEFLTNETTCSSRLDKYIQLQNKILASNVILEAFGNAVTTRNHNSSRFGKLIQLHYNNDLLEGGEIKIYLLEKTRLTHHTENERNFHIFYQLLSSQNGTPVDGHFKIATKLPSRTDEVKFKETLLAFKQLNFSQELQDKIFKVILSLLHLGNINFIQHQNPDKGWIIDPSDVTKHHVMKVCDYLSIEENHLISTLTVKTITVGSGVEGFVFHKPALLETECQDRKHALMQFVYNALFNRIVEFINGQIVQDGYVSKSLGILDIYGFETFESNSLEQLCINYSNERLQQLFTERFICSEQQVLIEEGFLDMEIPYIDNSLCVSALDSSVSVFAILNEECQLKRTEVPKEEDVCLRICKVFSGTDIIAPLSPVQKDGFIVHHYAGPVPYRSYGLLFKNKDEVPPQILTLIASSASSFCSVFVPRETNDLGSSPRQRARKVTTLSKFKGSLDSLMKYLSGCDLHYIRCIKPNLDGVPGVADPSCIEEQLRACGIFETIRISQAGFPVRLPYAEFVKRYGKRRSKSTVQASLQIVLEVFGELSHSGLPDPMKCRLGKKRIFLSEIGLCELEAAREHYYNSMAIFIQKHFKKFVLKRRYRKMKVACLKIQLWLRSVFAFKRYQRMKKAAVIIQRNVRRYFAQKRYHQTMSALLKVQYFTRRWIRRCRANRLKVNAVQPGSPLLLVEDMLDSVSFQDPSNHLGVDAEESGIETDIESWASTLYVESDHQSKGRHYIFPTITRFEGSVANSTSSLTLDTSYSSSRHVMHQHCINCHSLFTTCLRSVTVSSFSVGEVDARFSSVPFRSIHFINDDTAFYFSDRILSTRHVPQVRIKFITRKTCLPYSHNIPYSARSQGLYEILGF